MSSSPERQDGSGPTGSEPATSTAPAPSSPGGAGRGRRGVVLGAVSAVVAAVLLGLAITGLVVAQSTGSVRSVAEERDQALDAARSIASTLTTIDSADAAGTLDSWSGVVAGQLADDFNRNRDSYLAQFSQAEVRVTSQIQGAALTSLDAEAGTASALVFIDSVTTTGSAAAAPAASADPSTPPTTDAPAPSADPSTPPSSGAPAPSADSASPSADPAAQPAGVTGRLAVTMSLQQVDGTWKATELLRQGGGQ